jgi:4-amino-4-deoxy-L-arabinose transferase-like glycosyltransferase
MWRFKKMGDARPKTRGIRLHAGEPLPQDSGERRPWWAIAGLAAIAALAVVLYSWSLSRNGMGNSYYAAAVKSASVSWRAFFFGSLDPGSFITVDKPPVSIWIMALSARIFGLSSWSLLLPQAVAGVASVFVLHRLVRRWAGNASALVAALLFALTPVALAIFRYNNPDAFLTLLLLLAAWVVWSAVESGSTLKLTLAGVAMGFAFLTKMLMAFIVLPAFALVYLLFGPPRLGRRILQLLAAVGAMVVSGGWWIAIVELVPDAARPYVGGTTTNSWIDLIMSRTGGYLNTSASGAHMSGDPCWLRIFNDSLGGQVAWFIPLALVGLAAGLWITFPGPRTDKSRAGYVLWGLWTLIMIIVFNHIQGTFHSYYTVVLAPGVAALAGAGIVELWRLSRSHRWLVWLLPLAIAGTAVWSAVLLWRESGYAPGLALAVIVVGVVAAGALLVLFAYPCGGRIRRGCAWGATAACLVALLAGPFAYDLSTISRSVNGNSAAAGPISKGSLGSSADDLSVDEGLVAYLQEHQGDAKYLVAVQTTSASVPLILATGEPVVTIGGYKSRDPVPTAEQLQGMVAAGEVHYVLIKDADVSGSGSFSRAPGDSSAATEDTLQAATDWVTEQGTVVPASEYEGNSIDGTLYYLP